MQLLTPVQTSIAVSLTVVPYIKKYHTPLHWLMQFINQTLDKSPSISRPQRASYGVSIKRIWG